MTTSKGPQRQFQGASFKNVADGDTSTNVNADVRVRITAARSAPPQISLGATNSDGPASGLTKMIFVCFFARNDSCGMDLGICRRCFSKRHESGTHFAREDKPTEHTNTFYQAQSCSSHVLLLHLKVSFTRRCSGLHLRPQSPTTCTAMNVMNGSHRTHASFHLNKWSLIV